MECLETLPTDRSIMILDRHFGNYCTLRKLMDQGRLFCVRLSIKNSNFAKRVMQNPEDDYIIEWVPSEKERGSCRKNCIDPQPMKVRITKFLLDSGEIVLLVSNLYDTKELTTEDLSELYHLRWGVEEGYKNLKPEMKIEHFGCKKAQGSSRNSTPIYLL